MEKGFIACIERKAFPEEKELKTDGEFEAHLISLNVEVKSLSDNWNYI